MTSLAKPDWQARKKFIEVKKEQHMGRTQKNRCGNCDI
jgi:hypothetical protein